MAQAQSGIDAATDRELRFSGQPGVTIAAGETVWSDPLDFHLPPLGRLAVSVATGEVPEPLTGHSTSASKLQPGNAVSAADLKAAVGLDAGYLLSGVDVWAAPTSQAIVVLGDALSDGWPAALAERLQAQPATANIAVLNQALHGNALVLHGEGPTAARLWRPTNSNFGG